MKSKSAEYQNKVGEMVDREVYYCVSSLISELAGNEKYQDELMEVMVRDDWQSAAESAGIEIREDENGNWQYSTSDRPNPWQELRADDESDAWREACEQEGIGPDQREAYEHWVVSNWLARKLEAKGEMVLRDFYGLTIWGRCITGQAIKLDSVICKIYDEGPGFTTTTP